MDDQDHMHEPLVKEGYAYDFYPVRWKAYKPGAPTNKKGRWQRMMNEYGGWENCEKPAVVFHSPDLIEAQAAQLQEAQEAMEYISSLLPDDYSPQSIEGMAGRRARAFLAESQ
jgi:hypothetical protein